MSTAVKPDPFNDPEITPAPEVCCSICGRPAMKSFSKYGWWYRCTPCDASVGCHKGTHTPLGTFAQKALRDARMKAHLHFDGIWEGKYKTRSAAYKWLRERMELTKDECHIGMFTEEQCAKVVELCKKYFANRRAVEEEKERAANGAECADVIE